MAGHAARVPARRAAATAQAWIEQQLTTIVADRAVIRAVATATSADDLAGMVDRRLADEIRRQEGGRPPEARSGRFFTWYLDQPAVQDALHAFARAAVFNAVRAVTPAGPSSPPPEASDAATSETGGPGRTATAAQLARLDTDQVHRPDRPPRPRRAPRTRAPRPPPDAGRARVSRGQPRLLGRTPGSAQISSRVPR